MFHGHETRCFMPMKHLESGTVTTEISIFYIDFWFMVCIGVSLRCFMLFHCCFMLFHCCLTVIHRSVSWCFKMFHCSVSSCFMTMKQVKWEQAFSLLNMPSSSRAQWPGIGFHRQSVKRHRLKHSVVY